MTSESALQIASLAESGQDRLSLIYCRLEFGLDFHSLHWEHRVDGTWSTVRSISASEFQGNYGRKRWVTELRSFNASTGNAVIQVAEMVNLSDGSGSCHYSWHNWDVSRNEESTVVQVDTGPPSPWPAS